MPAAGSPFTPQGGATSGGGPSTPCPPPHYSHSPAPSGSSTPVGFNSHGPNQGPPGHQFPPGMYNGPGPNSPYFNNNFPPTGGPPQRPQPPRPNQFYSGPNHFPPGGPPPGFSSHPFSQQISQGKHFHFYCGYLICANFSEVRSGPQKYKQ